MRAWADGVVHRDEGVTRYRPQPSRHLLDLIVYYQEIVAQHHKQLTDDLTWRCSKPIDSNQLADDEVLGFMFLMVIAGNETAAEAACQRGVLGAQEPRSAHSGLRGPGARAAVGRGDAAL